MINDPQPTNITIDRPRQLLIIDWLDGAHCEYPLPGIRNICPCAECQGGHENMGQPIDPADLRRNPPPGVSSEVVSADILGGYALQITWADGHNAGIYAWTILRPLCPQAPSA
ncbi:MAG: DUF971 domain-containing protein [Chloroflexi bacterium]|nr:DUF971 domain-containing protein [Chloroflexota bacterium]